ncbi:MAG: hypothetical protein K8J08_20280 [Thermoanaerobaculia bacterium]|nr:hypothetical protein [Thermoanaerobaculia bacterium]
MARAGWESRLAAGVSALLVLTGISGLWIWLGPFSVTSQLILLAHSIVGLLALVPIVFYLWRHVSTWFRQKLTAAMFLGWALLGLGAVTMVSGLVVTWQAAFGQRVGDLWDWLHLVTGLAVLGLVVAHLVAAWLRRRPAAVRDTELAGAMGRFRRRQGFYLATPIVALLLAAFLWPETNYRHPPPEGYSLPIYAQKFEEYRGNPFAPSFARTDDLQMVRSELLAGSRGCGSAGCHPQILDEWLPSAHRFSAMNAPFQAVQKNFAEDREAAETRYCAGCHDPISLFAGAKDLHNLSLSAPGMDEGISCVACHSISEVDQRGNADYVLTPPEKYLGEVVARDGAAAKFLSDFLIRAYPGQHLADYDRNLLRSPEFCATCHKQFIPEALNRFGMVEGQNQYDEWKNGHWHSDDPELDLSCRDCHMRLVTESTDPGSGEGGDRRRDTEDGSHRHHGFIGTNFFIPQVMKLEGWERQVALTEEWVRGETVLPEIGDIWPEGPVASLELTHVERARAGDQVEVRAVIQNRKAGHNFITGPLDFVRSWIHLRAFDGNGELLAEWGAIDPTSRRILDVGGREHAIGNLRDEGTLVLEAMPVDGEGRELREHQLWQKAGGKGKRVVFPQYSDSHLFRLQIPPGTQGPVTIEADLQYRRYRQEFLDLVVPDMESASGVNQPTVTQASARSEISLDGP